MRLRMRRTLMQIFYRTRLDDSKETDFSSHDPRSTQLIMTTSTMRIVTKPKKTFKMQIILKLEWM